MSERQKITWSKGDPKFQQYVNFLCIRDSDKELYNKYQISISFKEWRAFINRTHEQFTELFLKSLNDPSAPHPKFFPDTFPAGIYFDDITTKLFPGEISEYLDFHYNEYKGDKLRFVYFIEWTIDDLIETQNEIIHRDNGPTFTGNEYFFRRMRDWIEEKLKKLKAEELQTETKKRTPRKLNEFNRPVLTQKQTAILFKLFKDHNLFVLQGLSKNRYEEIVSLLTGYSNNTLHQDFAEKDLLSISDKPDDYKMIIAKLQEIIEELRENIV